MEFEPIDLIVYIDADLEVPTGSIVTSSNGEKLTVVSNKLENRTPPISRVLSSKKHPEPKKPK